MEGINGPSRKVHPQLEFWKIPYYFVFRSGRTAGNFVFGDRAGLFLSRMSYPVRAERHWLAASPKEAPTGKAKHRNWRKLAFHLQKPDQCPSARGCPHFRAYGEYIWRIFKATTCILKSCLRVLFASFIFAIIYFSSYECLNIFRSFCGLIRNFAFSLYFLLDVFFFSMSSLSSIFKVSPLCKPHVVHFRVSLRIS